MKINKSDIIISIMLIGIAIRVIYVLYTPINVRQHDVNDKFEHGHLDYIYTLFTTGKLPTSNTYQFYQQPLHHIITAGWMKLCQFLNIDVNKNIELIQILPLIYSILIMIVIYKILKELKIDDKYKILVMLLVAIHPTFIILSGSVNNDILMFLFTFLAILYLLKWNKEQTTRNTVMLALFTALIALTKISGTIIAIPILYVFISKFVNDYKNNKNRKYIINKYLAKFSLFGVIALGFGLLYSVRNMILFKQSIFYVPNPGEDLYFGDKSLGEILKAFPRELAQIYCNPYKDCNAFAYIIKCSLFGEFALPSKDNFLSIILIVLNIILIAISLVSMFRVIRNKNVDQGSKQNLLIFIVFYLSEIFMYTYSIITKPYGCTMDFRYIIPTVFFGIMFIVYDIMNTKKNNKKYYTFFISIEILFAITSVIFEATYMQFLI